LTPHDFGLFAIALVVISREEGFEGGGRGGGRAENEGHG
jgi:hypothetical protein